MIPISTCATPPAQATAEPIKNLDSMILALDKSNVGHAPKINLQQTSLQGSQTHNYLSPLTAAQNLETAAQNLVNTPNLNQKVPFSVLCELVASALKRPGYIREPVSETPTVIQKQMRNLAQNKTQHNHQMSTIDTLALMDALSRFVRTYRDSTQAVTNAIQYVKSESQKPGLTKEFADCAQSLQGVCSFLKLQPNRCFTSSTLIGRNNTTLASLISQMRLENMECKTRLLSIGE